MLVKAGTFKKVSLILGPFAKFRGSGSPENAFAIGIAAVWTNHFLLFLRTGENRDVRVVSIFITYLIKECSAILYCRRLLFVPVPTLLLCPSLSLVGLVRVLLNAQTEEVEHQDRNVI